MKILTIIGARPQFIKASSVSRVLREFYSDSIEEVLVHTGQHFDYNMSESFFTQLQMSKPAYHLNMALDDDNALNNTVIRIEEIIKKEKPDAVIVYGDTNSTYVGTLSAFRSGVPIVHIEAGLRSYNDEMPEERNRIFCDNRSSILFAPTQKAIENLEIEGFDVNYREKYSIDKPGIFNVGDVMYDSILFYSELAEKQSDILKALNIENKTYYLLTFHRAANTDNFSRLNNILRGIYLLLESGKVIVWPVHPRTKNALKEVDFFGIFKKFIANGNLVLTSPLSYFDIIKLEKKSDLIITDSGGVQKEAYFLKKPSLILRRETEWVEIVNDGAAVLVDDNVDLLKNSADTFDTFEAVFNNHYGNGNASIKICEILKNANFCKG
jgi:UDP-GlcNAc3NAcA epimerase